MYTTSIILVVAGLLFTVINVFLLLKNYKFCLVNHKNKKILIPNIITLVAAFSMTILGIMYYFIIFNQL
ncbi:hypothetical protein IGM03_002526 [Enterococcus sp. DIV0436]